MFWSLSLHLMPDETILDDSSKQAVSVLKPTYSVFLSNKRVLFRFDGLGSSMTQSFLFSEIIDVRECKRMLVNYLELRTARKDHYLHIPQPAFWAARIIGQIRAAPGDAGDRPALERPALRKRQELRDMLDSLRKHNLLTKEEFDRKSRLVDDLQL